MGEKPYPVKTWRDENNDAFYKKMTPTPCPLPEGKGKKSIP